MIFWYLLDVERSTQHFFFFFFLMRCWHFIHRRQAGTLRWGWSKGCATSSFGPTHTKKFDSGYKRPQKWYRNDVESSPWEAITAIDPSSIRNTAKVHSNTKETEDTGLSFTCCMKVLTTQWMINFEISRGMTNCGSQDCPIHTQFFYKVLAKSLSPQQQNSCDRSKSSRKLPRIVGMSVLVGFEWYHPVQTIMSRRVRHFMIVVPFRGHACYVPVVLLRSSSI